MPDYAVNTIFSARDRVSSAFNNMGNGARNFGNKANRAFGMANSAGRLFGNTMRNLISRLMLFFGARALIRFANESVDAWNKQAAAIANVEATLISTNNMAGRTLQDLTTQAKEIQNKTFFGDESILQGVTAQLLTFGNIQGDVFDRVQMAAIDVAAKLKGLEATQEDLRAVTIMLGKAYNDPVSNLGALSRAGIQFSEQQEEMIKQMAAAGDFAGAQEMMLAEIEKMYGGTAEMLAQTSGGMEMQFKNLTGDMQEVIGRGLVPVKLAFFDVAKTVLADLNPALESFATWMESKLPEFRQFFQDFYNTAKQIFNIIGPPIGQVINAILNLGSVIYDLAMSIIPSFISENATLENGLDALTYVLNLAAGFIDMVAAGIKFLSPIIGPVITALGIWAAAQWAVNVAMSANPIGLIIIGIAALVAAIGWLSENWDAVVEWFKGGIDIIVGGFKAAGDIILGVFRGVFDFIIGVIDFVKSAIDEITGQAYNQKMLDMAVQRGMPEEEARQMGWNGGGKQEAPNRQEVEAQQFSIQGRLDIRGAPDGSTIEQKNSGGLGKFFNLEQLGVNP